MKLSKENKKKLIDEIRFVIGQMKQQEDPETKLYYFSAIFGIMPRIFNIDFNEDLIFAHFIISSTHNNINQRIKNPDKVIKLPDELFDRLLAITEELLVAIEKDQNLYDVLKKFTLLGYVTIGNGYYLYKKGMLKI